jgi:hypothetical protein
MLLARPVHPSQHPVIGGDLTDLEREQDVEPLQRHRAVNLEEVHR